jgi:tRNA threonylcarbamoyl adenosine modification protein YjeE
MANRIEGFSGRIPLPDLIATDALAARIAAGLRPGDCIALKGDLGAGKTTLARAILRRLGVAEHVPSPTFMLMQSYETAKGSVFHFDLYRVENAGELEELGFDEALGNGIVLVEWPERAGDLLPVTLNVTLEMHPEWGRLAAISGEIYWMQFLDKEKNHV